MYRQCCLAALYIFDYKTAVSRKEEMSTLSSIKDSDSGLCAFTHEHAFINSLAWGFGPASRAVNGTVV